MREGPSEPGCRPRFQTTWSCVGQKPSWCASQEKAGQGFCQVRVMETNASEPLMKCRKRMDGVKTGGSSLTRDKSGGDLFTVQAASGMKVA
ncbi:hypothetical protein LCGC14_1445920 [marine sediment metagenome]|uniref:Uncharacterized protein n=1 Tax=marine sediment metagenome TaxID=412755 RepID=A0A0F9JJY2_9ZZZZ